MAHRTEAERAAEAERIAFARSLGAFADAVSGARRPDAQATSIVETYGQDIARQTWAVAKKNPVGVALVGIGLGMLLTGKGGRTAPPDIHSADQDAGLGGQVEPPTPRGLTANRLRAKIDDGLAPLPQTARARVRDARLAAIVAQEDVEKHTSTQNTRAPAGKRFKPAAIGALALGLGTIFAARGEAKPSQVSALKIRRDQEMERARGIYRSEINQLYAAARTPSPTPVTSPQSDARSASAL